MPPTAAKAIHSASSTFGALSRCSFVWGLPPGSVRACLKFCSNVA